MNMKLNTIVLFVAVLFAGTATAQEISTLKKVLELKMPLTDEDNMCGTNGASVAWHPLQKRYFASFAGNEGFPLAVFAANGERLSSEHEKTRFDCRGLWYDVKTKKISGNGYDEAGWFNYGLNEKGMVRDVFNYVEGMRQPDANSVGAYNIIQKQVFFLNESSSAILQYTDNGSAIENEKPTILQWGISTKKITTLDAVESAVPDDYNTTTLVYTGMPDAELGVLNYNTHVIELYSLKTGLLRKKLYLPDDAPAESMFNFAFTNNLFWLFDKKKRTWFGYK